MIFLSVVTISAMLLGSLGRGPSSSKDQTPSLLDPLGLQKHKKKNSSPDVNPLNPLNPLANSDSDSQTSGIEDTTTTPSPIVNTPDPDMTTSPDEPTAPTTVSPVQSSANTPTPASIIQPVAKQAPQAQQKPLTSITTTPAKSSSEKSSVPAPASTSNLTIIVPIVVISVILLVIGIAYIFLKRANKKQEKLEFELNESLESGSYPAHHYNNTGPQMQESNGHKSRILSFLR